MNTELLEQIAQQEYSRQQKFHRRIFCCTSTACLSAGADLTHETLERSITGYDQDAVEVVKTGCMGLCSRGPMVRVETKDEAPVLYGEITPELAQQIIVRHVPRRDAPDVDAADATVSSHESHFHAQPKQTNSEFELDRYTVPLDLPFFAKQVKVVLNETGHIDPERLEDYLAHGGYQALKKVLTELTPQQVCDEILRSGLRGRGGAGFPTGLKWKLTLQEESAEKFVIVNGDEGDPGAYMDRTVMEDDPHRVLEGMMICAYAIGATYGYFYIRGEYPNAIRRIQRAIRAARRRGILGKSVMGTDFSFETDVRIGAGAFICGEETALIHSVEGKRGTPRMRPPYPSVSGLWGKPTVINNVETMGNVPSIINKGAEWFASIGTEKSKGTKVFALAGQLRNTGLIEVPMGITLREIVYEIGGGIPNGHDFKAAQTGGPSGGCIPAEFLDAPVDYESLKALGSIMGSGGLVIIDDSTLMPKFARFFIDFCVDESCGKCVPCRVGTIQIRALLDKIIGGKGQADDLDRLEGLCTLVQKTSLCGLGVSAPNPVVSTLKYFRHEYDSLINADHSSEIGAD